MIRYAVKLAETASGPGRPGAAASKESAVAGATALAAGASAPAASAAGQSSGRREFAATTAVAVLTEFSPAVGLLGEAPLAAELIGELAKGSESYGPKKLVTSGETPGNGSSPARRTRAARPICTDSSRSSS